jgi:hypothetical protein
MNSAYRDYVRSTWDAAVAAEQAHLLADRARILADSRKRGMIISGERWVNEVKLFAEHTERAILRCFAAFTEFSAGIDRFKRAELWSVVKRELVAMMRQHLDSNGRALERRAEAEGCGGSIVLAMNQTLGQRISNLLKLITDLVQQQVSADSIRGQEPPPLAAGAIYVNGNYCAKVEQVGDRNNVISNSTVAGATQASGRARVQVDNQVRVCPPEVDLATQKGWGNRALVLGGIVAAIITGVATLLSTEQGRGLFGFTTSKSGGPASLQTPTK